MDRGLSHIALTVRDVDRSIEFYRDFADFAVVHQRGAPGRRVVWLSDLRRPFVLVLVESASDDVRLDGVAHLGVACESREQVDRLCNRARTAGWLRREPEDAGTPVGYWALLRDPDGHNLELSYGQEVSAQVGRAKLRRSGGISTPPSGRWRGRRASRRTSVGVPGYKLGRGSEGGS